MNGKNILIGSGLALMVGAILPWGNIISIFGTQSISGIEGDGILTGGIGLALLLMAALIKGEPSKATGFGSIALSVIALWMLYPKYGAFTEIISTSEGVTGSLGTGLHLSVLGAILGIVAGLMILQAVSTESKKA